MERPVRDAAKKCCVKIENNAKRDGGHQFLRKGGGQGLPSLYGEKRRRKRFSGLPQPGPGHTVLSDRQYARPADW